MAYYLQLDGVDDFIKTPSITFNEIILDVIPEPMATANWLFDARVGIGFAYIVRQANGVYQAGVGTTFVNGAQQGTNTNLAIVDNVRQTIRTVYGAAGTDDVNIGAANNALAFGKLKLYSVTFKNAGATVARYDLTLGNVQDQSGNGRHATLTGGTWVSDGPVGVDVSYSYSTMQAVYAGRETTHSTAQSVYAERSEQAFTQQVIFADRTSEHTLQQAVYAERIVENPLKQASFAERYWDFALQIVVVDKPVNAPRKILITGMPSQRSLIIGVPKHIMLDGVSRYQVSLRGDLLAATNQDFELYKGDDQLIEVFISHPPPPNLSRREQLALQPVPVDLAGCSFKWAMKKNEYVAENIISKESPSEITLINAENGSIGIRIDKTDSQNLQPGDYYHVAVMIDANGKETTITTGTAKIRQRGI